MFWDEEFEIQNDELSILRSMSHRSEISIFVNKTGIEHYRILNYQDIKILIEDVTCPICHQLVHQPVACVYCEAFFCHECADLWLERANSFLDCPICRGDGVSDYQQQNQFIDNLDLFYSEKVPKIFSNILSKIKIECQNATKGCCESIPYLEKHQESECQYLEVRCKNYGCEEIYLKKDIDQHDKICQFKLLTCPHCNWGVIRRDIDAHIENCEYRLVECQYCTYSFYAYEINSHQDVKCDDRPVDCYICHKTYTKGLLRQHTPEVCYRELYEQTIAHSQKMGLQIHALESENKQLKKNCQYLSKELLKYKQNKFEINEEQNKFREDEIYDYPEDFESAGDEEDTQIRKKNEKNDKNGKGDKNTPNINLYTKNYGYRTGYKPCYISNQEDSSSYDEYKPSKKFGFFKSTDDEQKNSRIFTSSNKKDQDSSREINQLQYECIPQTIEEILTNSQVINSSPKQSQRCDKKYDIFGDFEEKYIPPEQKNLDIQNCDLLSFIENEINGAEQLLENDQMESTQSTFLDSEIWKK